MRDLHEPPLPLTGSCGTLGVMGQSFDIELEQLSAKFARELTREVTALILRRLGIEKTESRSPVNSARQPASRESRAPESKRAAQPARALEGKRAVLLQPSRRTRTTLEERAASLSEVERIVGASEGLSAGDIERRSGLSRAAVASALKALKDDGRLFMGGTKRFARYATTQSAADRASLEARGGTASQ